MWAVWVLVAIVVMFALCVAFRPQIIFSAADVYNRHFDFTASPALPYSIEPEERFPLHLSYVNTTQAANAEHRAPHFDAQPARPKNERNRRTPSQLYEFI